MDKLIDILPVWKIINSQNETVFLNPVKKSETIDDGVSEICFFDEAVSCEIKRTIFQYSENVTVIFESHNFLEPVKLHSTFFTKTGENMTCNIASKTRIVLKNNGVGEKFFLLKRFADGEDITDSSGLMVPDGFYDGNKMGINWYSGLKRAAKKHKALYVIFHDTDKDIPYWHAKEDKEIIIKDKENKECFRIFVDKDSFEIKASLA